MSHYRHIIWDWNGTLFNDTWLCLDIMNRHLVTTKKPAITLAQYQEIFDFPVRRFYERVGFDFSRTPYEHFAQEFIREYAQRRFEATLHHGVQGVLSALKEAGFRQSLLSAYAEVELIRMVRHFRIESFFTHIVGLDNHYAAGKKEEGKRIIRLIGLPASAVILIGDTIHDYEVAESLGIATLLVSQGHHNHERLSRCPVPVVRSLEEVQQFICS